MKETLNLKVADTSKPAPGENSPEDMNKVINLEEKNSIKETPDGALEEAIKLIIKRRGGEEAFFKAYHSERSNYVLDEIRFAVAPNVTEEAEVKELYKRIDELLRDKFSGQLAEAA